jgi:competence protein ComEC
MRRPLVLVGFCYLLTLAAAVFFGTSLSFVLLWICLAGFAVTFFWWRTRRAVVFPLAFAVAAVALASFCIYSRTAVEPPRSLDGITAEVSGTVCELPEQRYGRWYYVIRVDSVSGAEGIKNFKIRLSSSNRLEVGPYSRVDGKVSFFLPSGGDGFTSRSYYASKGIMLSAYAPWGEALKVLPPCEKPPYYYALRMRQKLLNALDEVLPPQEASLVKGILLGETGGLSDSLVDDFRTDGVSHILSVSGLHMSTIAELLIFLLLFCRVPKRAASVTAACGVLGFMAVTCFVPSVTRSGVMCLLYLTGPLISRRADSLNSLCTAALLICIPNPYAAADVGFLLSFFATLGLIVCTWPITTFLNKRFDRIRFFSPLVKGVNGVLATSVGATLFTLPIIILSFGTMSLVSPLANILELVPSSLLMCFGAAAAVFQLLLPQTFLAMPFALVSGLLAKYMRVSAAFLARIPFASVSASQGFVTLWLAGTLLLFAAALFLAKGRKLFPQAVCLSLILLLVGIGSFQLSRQNVTRLTLLDGGDGISAVLTRGGHAFVVGCDSYNSGKLLSRLCGENVAKLDGIVVLTQNRDEFTCAKELAGRFPPAKVVAQQTTAADGYVRRAAENGLLIPFASRAECTVWSNVKIELVQTGKTTATRITADGVTVLLCPDGVKAQDLPEAWKTPDFLVVGSSPSALEDVSPVCTVFSVENETLRKKASAAAARRAVWTGGYGDIVLNVTGERKLSVGREK